MQIYVLSIFYHRISQEWFGTSYRYSESEATVAYAPCATLTRHQSLPVGSWHARVSLTVVIIIVMIIIMNIIIIISIIHEYYIINFWIAPLENTLNSEIRTSTSSRLKSLLLARRGLICIGHWGENPETKWFLSWFAMKVAIAENLSWRSCLGLGCIYLGPRCWLTEVLLLGWISALSMHLLPPQEGSDNRLHCHKSFTVWHRVNSEITEPSWGKTKTKVTNAGLDAKLSLYMFLSLYRYM